MKTNDSVACVESCTVSPGAEILPVQPGTFIDPCDKRMFRPVFRVTFPGILQGPAPVRTSVQPHRQPASIKVLGQAVRIYAARDYGARGDSRPSNGPLHSAPRALLLALFIPDTIILAFKVTFVRPSFFLLPLAMMKGMRKANPTFVKSGSFIRVAFFMWAPRCCALSGVLN